MLQRTIRLHGEFGANDAGDSGGVSGLRKADGTTEFVVIGERDGRLSGDHDTRDEFFRCGRAIQQREGAVTVQLDVCRSALSHTTPAASRRHCRYR